MSVFIRKYSVKSGGTVVQVIYKRGRKVERTVHIGTAHTADDLDTLIALANQTINAHQLTLDVFADGLPTNAIGYTLEKTYSKLLYETLGLVYDRLGFDAIEDKVFKQLVLARIIEPTSKLDTIRVLDELGITPPSNTTIHRSLKRSIAKDYRSSLSVAALQNSSTSALSLVLYDVTTLYFESQKEDDYRKSGPSKERRLDPQIVVGLLIDRNGMPLEVASFEGNKAEVKTIVPVLESFISRHGLAGVTVVADAAMLSGANLTELEELGFGYIVDCQYLFRHNN
ncbi:MAG: IS1634 family transposase [Coriobacteriia bacterium]|nr:IS1634 family transposase [Coriobacteriia bacterium]